MNGIQYDELKIYRGSEYNIAPNIVIHHPTIGEICDYGEKEYFSMVSTLTASPSNMMWQLWENGVDFTTITDFELFYSFLLKMFPQNKTSILFGDLDFRKFSLYQKKNTDGVVLINDKNGAMIDEYTYMYLVTVLRKMHGFERYEKIPGTENTKMILIEDAKAEAFRNQYSEYHSRLKNYISAMVNSEGFKFSYKEVWDMHINAFMDSVHRIMKIKNASLLLQSGYSAFGINLKDVDKKQIDWLGEL